MSTTERCPDEAELVRHARDYRRQIECETDPEQLAVYRAAASLVMGALRQRSARLWREWRANAKLAEKRLEERG